MNRLIGRMLLKKSKYGVVMQIMGHRGAKNEKPENTLLGFRHAIDCKVDSIEIDVHLTKDKKLVVIHDETMDRTTNLKGAVLDLTYEEILKADAGEGEKVPLLSEVIEYMKSTNADLVIEIKAANCEKQVVQLVEEFDMVSRVWAISFNHRIIKKVKELNSNIRTAYLLYGLPLNVAEIAKACGSDGLSLSVKTIDKELVEDAHKAGLHVTVWNANTKEEVQHFADMGVDVIGTDCPSQV